MASVAPAHFVQPLVNKLLTENMPESNEVEVSITPYNGSKLIELDVEHGNALLSLNTSGWLCVSNIDVEVGFRREGIGRRLLKKAMEIAEAERANVIYAALISREAIVLFGNVFGEENLRIHSMGAFTDELGLGGEPAHASMWYTMPNNESNIDK